MVAVSALPPLGQMEVPTPTNQSPKQIIPSYYHTAVPPASPELPKESSSASGWLLLSPCLHLSFFFFFWLSTHFDEKWV